MNRLIYGVRFVSRRREPPLPRGPGDCETMLLCEGELAAAYSAIDGSAGRPATPQLLAYARVIEDLHRRGPFAPMRYGCLLADEAAIRELLRTRHADFLAMLEEITDCDEFGLRILPAIAGRMTENSRSAPSYVAALFASDHAGARYLAGRNQWYRQRDRDRRCAEAIAERCRTTFAGLYERCEHDDSATPGPIQSLSFLVRRQHQARFHAAFRELQQASAEKLLLTGPWPPYHFVALGRTESAT